MRLKKHFSQKDFSFSRILRMGSMLLVLSMVCSLLASCEGLIEPTTEESSTVEEVVAPLTDPSGATLTEGADINEVTSAVECDGRTDENGKIIPGSQRTVPTSDDCDQIKEAPYYEGGLNDHVTVYYRTSTGQRILIQENYRPDPTTIYVVSGRRSVIMPYSMMYAGDRPVFQGKKPVLGSTRNTATTIRTPFTVNNGRTTVSPLKSKVNFVTPIGGGKISGGKVTSVVRSGGTRASRGLSFGSSSGRGGG